MKKFIALIIIGLLAVGMTGCATNDSLQRATEIQTSEVALSNTITNEPSSSTLDDMQSFKNPLLAYRDVLQNKTEFTTTFHVEGETRTIFLNQLLNDGPTTYKIMNFSVLDMDGDEIPEVIIHYGLPGGSYHEFSEVLHYSNGTVNGYYFGYRSLFLLKEDGSFAWSNASNDNGYAKLRFTSNTYEYENLGYCKPNFPTESCFINNQPVTENEYHDFIDSQDDKRDAIWFDFTNENIYNQLSVN